METQTIRNNHIRKKQANNRFFASIATILIVVLGLVYAGMKIQQLRTPERLPANTACISYAEQLPVYLQAVVNEQFGVTKPEGTPSKDDIKKLEADCTSNQTKYEVMVAQ